VSRSGEAWSWGAAAALLRDSINKASPIFLTANHRQRICAIIDVPDRVPQAVTNASADRDSMM
jgi:hypothetical protein